MKAPCCLLAAVLIALGLSAGTRLLAQDDVTIPKSRLEELERKEQELERLKSDVNKKKAEENTEVKKEKTTSTPTSNAMPEPVVAHVSPPIATLPPIGRDEIVESLDLANYYHLDVASADQRYRHQKFRVRGEIVGFEKPLLLRNYRVVLKSAAGDNKIICDLLPPENCKTVFTANHGSQLVGLSGETRTLLAKVGDIAVVKGECKGLHDGVVMLSCWELALMR